MQISCLYHLYCFNCQGLQAFKSDQQLRTQLSLWCRSIGDHKVQIVSGVIAYLILKISAFSTRDKMV